MERTNASFHDDILVLFELFNEDDVNLNDVLQSISDYFFEFNYEFKIKQYPLKNVQVDIIYTLPWSFSYDYDYRDQEGDVSKYEIKTNILNICENQITILDFSFLAHFEFIKKTILTKLDKSTNQMELKEVTFHDVNDLPDSDDATATWEDLIRDDYNNPKWKTYCGAVIQEEDIINLKVIQEMMSTDFKFIFEHDIANDVLDLLNSSGIKYLHYP